jgi:hypothetical protein
MPTLAFDTLEWKIAPMPGSSGPVELARLPDLHDRAFRAFVRFPAGWSRPSAGHYAVPEEFFVLSGDLTLNQQTWHAGGFARISAGRVRSGSHSISGCLAFAWFGAAPHWKAGEPSVPATDTDANFRHWLEAPLRNLPDGTRARELFACQNHRTWLLEGVMAHAMVSGDSAYEALNLRNHNWSWNEPIDSQASPTETILVRMR